jgi:crotonobetainyl-CoA:carnitine CoA-transferase CaiB-like acyl-CoA transferase
LVMCSITPFGLTGPHRDYRAYELTIAHGGGWAWLSPGGSDQPELPPLKAAGQQADFQGGLAAATAALAAYYRALQTGEGEHIDLSSQAYIASFLELNVIYYTYLGQVASRLGKRLLYPWGIFECQDGLMFLAVAEEDQWQRLVALMGNPEWSTWEIFQGVTNRTKNQDSMSDLARQEQLHARHFFVDVPHPRAGTLTHLGAPFQLHEPWWKIRRAAPLLGEHNDEVNASLKHVKTSLEQVKGSPQPVESSLGQVKTSLVEQGRLRTPDSELQSAKPRLPLEGVRVADFSWVWAGPFCTMHLAHLGAEVIKIESQTRLDLTRRLPFYPKDVEPGVNRCALFNQWNQGKKSLLLNLTTAKGIAIAKELVKKSDIVVENFATGVMDHLGLGYEELRKLKPDLIMASISGYGHTGPQRDYMAYGPAIAPLTGLSSLTGYEEGPPQEVGISYGDPNSGIHAAVAICAALAARQRTGRGQYIDVSLWEAMEVLVPEGWMDYAMNGTQPPRHGNRDLWMAPHNCFHCAGEDEWVTIVCGTEAEWRALCQAIGQPQLADDARFHTAQARKANEDALEQTLTAWTATREKWVVTRTLQAVGVAAFPSMTSKDLVDDPHLNARGFFARLPHPEVGVRTHTGIPWLLTHAANGVRTPAPLLGQDTDQVMRDVLCYSPQEIARLKEEQVLY